MPQNANYAKRNASIMGISLVERDRYRPQVNCDYYIFIGFARRVAHAFFLKPVLG